MTDITDAERLAALEAQLARMQATQQAEQDMARASRELLNRPPGSKDPELNRDSYAAANLRLQQARIAAANEAMALQQADYDAQLVSNAPAIEKIEEEIREVDARAAAERAKYDAAMSKLTPKRNSLRAKLDALHEMPPVPHVEPDYDEKDVDLILNYGRPANSPRVTLDDLRVVGSYTAYGHEQPITAEMARTQREKAEASRR